MMMAGGMTVTEDTPPDMLAGSMDLAVVLPDGHTIKMSVERSTPMMDLLVQVTTANKISPAGYILKPHNERGPLPYKPSTPIGALDAWTIHVVPKQLGQCPAIKKPLKLLNQPFEQTFRLQVHLPRNQLYVARVSPKTRLSDILLQVCSEKNLDPLKYSLRHPSYSPTRPSRFFVYSIKLNAIQEYKDTKNLDGVVNLDQVLSLHYTLGDYKLQELTLVCNKTRPVEVSSVDIMSLQRETANPAYRNSKCEGSVSSGSLEGRSLSPVPSDESSASPPPLPLPLPPSRPIRKRRPAPKPPTILQKPVISEKQVNGIQPSTVINHSRNSSDSSGYHEASVLSESPQNNSVPESRKVEAPLTATLSQSMTDVSAIPSRPLLQSASSNSISSLNSATGSATGRKKKSAPPPPPVAKDGAKTTVRSPSVSSTASSTTTLDGNEATATVKSATLPPSTRLNTTLIPPPPPVTPPSTPTTPATPPVAVEPSITPQVAPPVPRPRSKLLSESDETAVKPASPKKFPAPQPKPRNILKPSTSPIENKCVKSEEISENPEEIRKKKHPLIRKILPSSFFNSHKACVEELAFKFDVDANKCSNDANETEPRIEYLPDVEGSVLKNNPSSLETVDSAGEHKIAKEDDESRSAESKSDAEISTAVVGANSEPDTDLRLADEEIDRIFSKATENHTSPEIEEEEEEGTPMMSLPSPVTSLGPQQTSSEDQLDWEYRLPAPPTFRDETKSPSVTEFGTVTIGNLSDVVCSQTVKEESQSKTEPENVNFVEPKKIDDVNFKKPNEVVSVVNNTDSFDDPMMRPLRKEIRSSSASSIYECETWKSSRSSIHSVEQEVINELTSTLPNRPRINLNDIEAKQSKVDLSTRNTLDNFTITTYKDTKPLGVFEDDSIKSSTGEKRDKSKDDAVFRAPKPRVKEPNLLRTSSFSIENNPNPVIKRSVSYVSLLAANMPRHSQPYRAHLQRHRSSVGPELDYPKLRKTSSEVNIDKQGHNKENLWQNDSTELQSVQVLRNILSRSHANLSSSIEETENIAHNQQRDSPTPDAENIKKISSGAWEESQPEESSDKCKTPVQTFELRASVGEEPTKSSYVTRGPPSINLSTWSERPKRQVSIKNDGEYISGFGKKPTGQDSVTDTDKKEESHSSPPKHEFACSVRNESCKLDEKSKSISDLSRIPIVRSVELKKPYTGNSFDQTRLKHVEVRNVTKSNSEAEDDSKQNGDKGFIGVDSLARRFGVPQKRPVSEYFGTLKYKDLQSTVENSSRNKALYNSPAVINVNSSVNISNGSNDPQSKSFVSNNKVDSTTEVKTQSKIRSGGFVENSFETSALKRTVSQPSHINSLSEAPQTSYINISSGFKPSNVSSVAISSNKDHKTPSSSIYIKQSQTLDRKFPVSLQPVVKGFRVPSDINSNTSQPIVSSTIKKDLSVSSSNSSESQTFPVQKASYSRTLSTPSISITSANVKEAGRENPLNNVRLRTSSGSSISQAKAEVAGSIPPPPPMMPLLRPVGERKGVKLLPAPTADPRDQLMESIRAFGKDSLKKVSNGAKSSD